MVEPGLTRRNLLSLVAGAAVLPVAAVSCGRGPAGSSISQVKRPLHYSSLSDVSKLIAARELQSIASNIMAASSTVRVIGPILATSGSTFSVA
jgi:hypothetical protein